MKRIFGNSVWIFLLLSLISSGLNAATIIGTVSDDAETLPNIEVCANSETCWDGQDYGCTQTDENGDYSLDGIPQGATVYLHARGGQGYVNEHYDGVNGNGTYDCNQAVGVPVGSSGIDFYLDLAGSIQGTITDGSGIPVPNVCVNVSSAVPPDWNHVAGTCCSDANGVYTVNGIPAGQNVYVQTHASCDDSNMNLIDEWYAGDGNSARNSAEAQPVLIEVRQTSPGIDFQLDAGGSISGTVTDLDGQPVQGLTLQIYDGPCWDNYLTDVLTDDSGQYVAGGLHEGDVYVRACADCNHMPYQTVWWDGGDGIGDVSCHMAAPVQVNPGQETPGIDFQMVEGQRRVNYYEMQNHEGHLGAGFGVYENFKQYLSEAKLHFPDGSTYTFDLNSDYFDIQTECSGTDGWWHEFEDPITYGDYTISVTFQDGVTKTYTKEMREVSLPPEVQTDTISAQVQANGDIAFEWDAPGTNHNYQLRIYKSGKRYYSSSWMLDTYQSTVPADQLKCLEKGETYSMQVRIYDDSDWRSYQAMSKSDNVPFTYNPGTPDPDAFQDRITWSAVTDWKDDFYYGFSVRPGSRDNITSATMSGPDGTYTFNLVSDWYDLATETNTVKCWWSPQESQPVEGEYTLEVFFKDEYSETRTLTWSPASVAVEPVDASSMDQWVAPDGGVWFSWDTSNLSPELEHQVIVHSADDSKRFFKSNRETDLQGVMASQSDLRGLTFGKTYIWYVMSSSPSGSTVKFSQPRSFLYDPFALGTAFQYIGLYSDNTAEGWFLTTEIMVTQGEETAATEYSWDGTPFYDLDYWTWGGGLYEGYSDNVTETSGDPPPNFTGSIFTWQYSDGETDLWARMDDPISGSDIIQIPLCDDFQVESSGAHPTFSWTNDGTDVDYYRIRVLDQAGELLGQSVVDYAQNVTHTVDWYTFEPGIDYTIRLEARMDTIGFSVHDQDGNPVAAEWGAGLLNRSKTFHAYSYGYADSDNDGVLDSLEDTNGNGEVDQGETDPNNPDTDRDGLQDGTELGYTLENVSDQYTDTNIFQPDLDSTTTTDPLNPDTDGDGIDDGQEDPNYNGRVDSGETDPNSADSSPNKAMPWLMLLLDE